jgi:ribosomal protein L29
MKTKALNDIRGKDAAVLEKLLAEKRAALQTYRFNVAGAKVKNMQEGKSLRRDIAQILTVLGEKTRTNK